MSNSLDSGIAVIHSNQLEALRDVVEHWLRQHPLAPLENEVLLVQSNGMGQWLKQSLAQNNALGIAAAMHIQLPSLFIWSVYRAVLGQQIPKQQPLAKAPLSWRLYRLLPALISRTGFESLAHFLQHDFNSRKRFQLAEQLADLFDQYQVYRSDWIVDWAAGQDTFRDAHGEARPLPDRQIWQSQLWRAILEDLGSDYNPFASRASVHAQFMANVDTLRQRPAGIPRRIVIFGLSSLPQQSLEVLAKLGRFCQVVLFVHNPCQHYWADIIEDKELLKAQRKRQTYKAGMAAGLNPELLHLHANPLLAAWGKQGRDYIRLLDHFDETQAYADWHWPDHKIDLFKDYGDDGRRSILQRLQQSILDLEPIPEQPLLLDKPDQSLAFHIAHSRQREVEILHDQLLARFDAAQLAGEILYPRDIIVMVPDINQYAPHIRAVFGQVQAEDPRHIPFSLADQQQRGENPLLVAVETLLNLPESRFNVSEFLGLLEVPALRLRFDIDETAIPKLHQWLEQAGIRWGLNAEQRARTVEMPADFAANTWQFGLRRMLLGYAVGAGDAFNGIEPYPEIGGLDAQWLGHLCHILDTLERYAGSLGHEQNADAWLQALSQLLADFFVADNQRDRKTLDTLRLALGNWHQACLQGGCGANDLLPLNVVREAWLAAVDEPNLQQRFLSGRVNFCTLMPMRAIPFRVICLLGMNDGDYPRNQYPHGFDLMNQRGQYRPGDRSRRQDDQYLFLEALLSARQQLYISWIGRSIRDNSERPPSVLIAQLRDFLQQSFGLADGQKLLETLTLEHPLQPFSPDYIKSNRDPRLFSYAREWFQPSPDEATVATDETASEEISYTLNLEALARFLRAPVKTYCQHSLKFSFDSEDVTSEDNEPFGFDRLQAHIHGKELLQDLQSRQPVDLDGFYQQQMTALSAKGALPLGGFAQTTFAGIANPADRAWHQYRMLLEQWPQEIPPRHIELSFVIADHINVQLSAGLNQLRRADADDPCALLSLTAQTLLKKDLIQYHNLILPWLRHLAACADGLSVHSFIAAADSIITIQPLPQADAISHLQTLLESWRQGMRAPLPVACRTAFAWLNTSEEKALETAQAQYDGDEWNPGEVTYDTYLGRFFPSFASLYQTETAHFEHWATALYQPLYRHLTPLQPCNTLPTDESGPPGN
ncbi:MAG: exodeoxyribonuclease V subunit gamma [Methylomonas sp.]|jgi:exodeoxyribonuclease V gamma subunit|uniref:exodeoxyribonuclease V subunit gamma n=1 Tax=Methylomonas sp. TaxID=418 RepID=UPI0025D814D7|nr:exodeoxyribonuclease V subunit gamma [Methylomonas sp.]MCK9606454.1 exodeoxyribonuclease V subunit gamma [Methylomonas sp.]